MNVFVAAAADKKRHLQPAKPLSRAFAIIASPDAVLLTDLLPDLHTLGYLVEPFGKDTFLVQGTPADTGQGNENADIEHLHEQFSHYSSELKIYKREKHLRSMAWPQAVKAGAPLDPKEMRALATGLFACEQPNTTPAGFPSYIEFSNEYVEKLFGK